MSNEPTPKSILGRTYKAELLEDDIFYVQIRGDLSFEIEDAVDMKEAARVLGGGSKLYNVFDLSSTFLPSDEARDYSISPEGTTYVIAHAFVVKSLAQRMMGNFMIRFQNPYVPIKLFNTVDSAMNWVRMLKAEK